MRQKDKKRSDELSENIEKPIAGKYSKGMIDLLGYDIIKSTYDSTLLYIEDAQKFSNEVRTKGLQSAGLLVTLIVALVTGICTIGNLFAKIVMIAITVVLASCLRGIFKGIIYRKENVSKGNTQSNLLNQNMIDAIYAADENKRKSIFFVSQLRNKEKAAEMLNKQTDEMQKCFENETKKMVALITWIIYIASAFAILFYFCLPVS